MLRASLFWALVALNLTAFAISLVRLIANQTSETMIVAVTLLANVIGVFYTKRHWKASSAGAVVTQTHNTAGGDIAAGNITKGPDAQIGN